jgi:hypothetical protein
LSGATTTLASLTIYNVGNYVISGKAVVTGNGTAGQVYCDLTTPSVLDSSGVTLQAEPFNFIEQATISLLAVASFSQTTQVSISCTTDIAGGGGAYSVHLTAIPTSEINPPPNLADAKVPGRRGHMAEELGASRRLVANWGEPK